MGTQYERSIDVAAPIERAWEALTEPRLIEGWLAPEVFGVDARTGGKLHWCMTGYSEIEAEFLEVDAPRLMRWHERGVTGKDPSEVTIALAPTADGTRIDIVHAGSWERVPAGYSIGWDQAIADLILVIEHGVGLNRHQLHPWIGLRTENCRTGVKVVQVMPGRWGERVGLAVGDLLLKIDRASIFGVGDVWDAGRRHDPGDELEAVYLHEGELRRGTAAL